MSKIPKRALRDPSRWAAELVGTPDGARPLRDDMRRDVDALEPLAARLRALDERRGRTSREIGEARAAGSDPASAIAAMREAGERARALEDELRAALQSIAERAGAAERPGTATELPSGTPGRESNGAVPAYFEHATRRRNTAPGEVSVGAVRTDEEAGAYTGYLRSHPARTAYHELALRELIRHVNGQESHHLIARDDDGTVRGILPLVRLASPLLGDFMVSMPWFNYGGPLAEDDVASEALVRAAGEAAREHGCSHAEIRESAPRAGWPARTDKVSMTLALPDSVATLDKDFGASLRAQSNKAVRAGCTFRTGGRELLDDFYRVFSVNMRDLGTPVQSRAFFDGLLELFGDDAFLATVSRDGRPLAAAFLLAHGGETLEIPWASSLRRANPLGVNMLLYRRTLAEALSRGYRHFDFGRSTMGGPTWRFKKQWGAAPRQLHWHYWTADGGEVAGPSADSAKFRAAIAVWQRLPLAVTRRLGPSLVRGLP